MAEIRVLLLGMGGNVSQGILKSVRASGLECFVIGACVSPDSEGIYLCDKAYLSPYAASDAFVPWLVDLCNKEKIKIVLTGVEENIHAIEANRARIRAQTDTIMRTSSMEQLEIGKDKYLTCLWLRANGFGAPGCCVSEDEKSALALACQYGYPLIAKPRRGKGSVGVFLVHNDEELRKAVALPDYVIQENIGTSDEEYTIGCYRGLDGLLPTPIILHRTLRGGSTWKATVVDHPMILKEAQDICSRFEPDGPLNIQLRLNREGKPITFELNVRFSGTTPMRAQFGFRDVRAMLMESVLMQDIRDCFQICKGIAIRYVNEMYLSGDVGSFENGNSFDTLRVWTDPLGNPRPDP